MYIYIYIYPQVSLVIWGSLILSCHQSLSSNAPVRSSCLRLEFVYSLYMHILVGRPALTRPCIGILRRTSIMLVLTSGAVSSMCCSSYWDIFWDERKVAVQLLFWMSYAFSICSKQHVGLLCTFHLAFPVGVSLDNTRCIPTVELTEPQHDRNSFMQHYV